MYKTYLFPVLVGRFYPPPNAYRLNTIKVNKHKIKNTLLVCKNV